MTRRTLGPSLRPEAMCGYQFPGRNSKKVVHVAVAQLQGRQEATLNHRAHDLVHLSIGYNMLIRPLRNYRWVIVILSYLDYRYRWVIDGL